MDVDHKKSKVSIMRLKSTTKAKSQMFAQNKSCSRMKIRKQSYGFGNVPGIRGIEAKMSQLGFDFRRPPLMFLNTYQLEPHVKFNAPAVHKEIETVLDIFFIDHKYNLQESPALALHVAAEVTRSVKHLNFDRYRIISVVTLTQKRAQSYNNAVAFLWDHERDSIVNVQREVPTALIQVTVFGVYLD